MIVSARMKGNHDIATATGWHAERFARTKNVKSLGEYLKQPPTPAEKQATGIAKVQALFARKLLEAKGK